METILFIALLGVFSINIASWFVLYKLVEQRGRLLLRLDDTEKRLKEVEQLLAPKLGGRESTNTYASELRVGTMLDFQLPDIAGRTVALKDFRGQRVLLVAWDPNNEACRQIAPELAKLQSEFHRHKVHMVLITTQDQTSNQHLAQKHGLEFPILFHFQENYLEAFRNTDTPTAYLVDENGYITYPRVEGTHQVLALARESISTQTVDRAHVVGNRSLSASRIEREGLKAGILAPSFNLPTIYGETVSLEEYRGRRVLLVFTSPHCAPCDFLAPHLVKLQQHIDNHIALLMIGRGDSGENLMKAEAYGIRFPVALQKHWEISKEYGIFSTPVAFLIDEGGIIAQNVARGADEILALAREGLGVGKEKVYEQPV